MSQPEKRTREDDDFNPGYFVAAAADSSPNVGLDFHPVYNEISKEVFEVLLVACSSKEPQPSYSYRVLIAGALKNGDHFNMILKKKTGELHYINETETLPDSLEWNMPSYNWNTPINTLPQSLPQLVLSVVLCLTPLEMELLQYKQKALDIEAVKRNITSLLETCQGRQKLNVQLVYWNRRTLQKMVEHMTDKMKILKTQTQGHEDKISKLEISKQEVGDKLKKIWTDVTECHNEIAIVTAEVEQAQGALNGVQDQFVHLFPAETLTFESPEKVKEKVERDLQANVDRKLELELISKAATKSLEVSCTSVKRSTAQVASAEAYLAKKSCLYAMSTNSYRDMKQMDETKDTKERMAHSFNQYGKYFQTEVQEDLRWLFNDASLAEYTFFYDKKTKRKNIEGPFEKEVGIIGTATDAQVLVMSDFLKNHYRKFISSKKNDTRAMVNRSAVTCGRDDPITVVTFGENEKLRQREDHPNSILSLLVFSKDAPRIRDYLVNVHEIDRKAVAPDFYKGGPLILDIPTLICNDRYRYIETSGLVTEQSFVNAKAVDLSLRGTLVDTKHKFFREIDFKGKIRSQIEQLEADVVSFKKELGDKEAAHEAAKASLADCEADRRDLKQQEQELERILQQIPDLETEYNTAHTSLTALKSKKEEWEGRSKKAKEQLRVATLEESDIIKSLDKEKGELGSKKTLYDALRTDPHYVNTSSRIDDYDRQVDEFKTRFVDDAVVWMDEVQSEETFRPLQILVEQAEKRLGESRDELLRLEKQELAEVDVKEGVLAEHFSSRGATKLGDLLGQGVPFCQSGARLALIEAMNLIQAPVVFVEGNKGDRIELPGKQVINVLQNDEAGSVTSSDASDTPSEAGSDASTPLELSEAVASSTPSDQASTPSESTPSESSEAASTPESSAAVANTTSSTDTGEIHVSIFV